MSVERSGTVDFVVGTETYQTWYKIIGDLSSGIRPLVALHGGPGVSHHYMLPHVELYKAHGKPIVVYDQLGNGQSTLLPDKPKEFWQPALFVDELDNLLKVLGISEAYDVVGHSWGGMLAASYITSRQPRGLKLLVLVGTPASMTLWDKGTQMLLARLPKETQEMLRRHEEAGTTDDPEYQKGVEDFYAKHMCKVQPHPEDLAKSFQALHNVPTVYSAMQGPSEFFTTGSLKTWTVVEKLELIVQPTLIINGYDDEARDVCVAPYFERLPKSKWVQFMNSSHMAFFEEPKRYFDIVGRFLTETAV